MIGWVRANLFGSWFSGVITVASIVIAGLALWFGLRWVIFEADWSVVVVLGGRMIIGQYNTEAACPGQNCFWRPQVSLLMVTTLLGMAWGYTGGTITKRVVIGVAVVLAAFAFLPYRFETMGLDVRLLLAANLPALALGWALARYTRLGSVRWIALLGVAAFLLTLVLLGGLPGVPGLQQVSVIHWGGLMLNLLLAVAGIVGLLPDRHRSGAGAARQPAGREGPVRGLHRSLPRSAPHHPAFHVPGAGAAAFPEAFPQNSLFRAAVVIILFSLGLHGGNIRGGLQALRPGQAEAARALGLPAWQTTLVILLPQAIRNVIPAIVGQFIALFKDTTLVYIIGMLDVVEFSRAFIQGNTEYIASARELFICLAPDLLDFHLHHVLREPKVERELGVGER